MRLILVLLIGAIMLLSGCVYNIPFLNSGPPSFMTKCTTDADCTSVCAAKDCCCTCKDTAINKKYIAEWDYGNAKYCQSKNATCAKLPCDHTSTPLCISSACILNKTAVEQP